MRDNGTPFAGHVSGASPGSYSHAEHLGDDLQLKAEGRNSISGLQRAHTVPEPQALERLRRTVRAKRARAAGMSPAALALRSDVVRRAASRGGTLRCAKARRVAYRNVNKSYASYRLS